MFEKDIVTKLRRNVAKDDKADDLKALADAALRQIDEKDYLASLRADGVADVMKIGLAYFGKRVELSVG